MANDRITVTGGTEVYVSRDPVGFFGDRIRVTHSDAPQDLQNVEVGLIVENHHKHYLQLPEQEFGMSPEVLRAIADLLEGGQN